MRVVVLLLLLISCFNANSQSDSVWQSNTEVMISGFADVYYFYDFNEPQGTSRQPFLYNHNRHNGFNLNLGLVKLSVDHAKYRANFSLQAGTYANDNYAAEPGVLKNIFEANVGLALNKQNNLWLDAGILPSHIGFESAISMDNYTLTRSFSAENSPYFLTGAKLTATPSDQWEFAALVTNGWQRIQRLPGNSLLSLGTQVVYSPSDNVLFNWSTFLGTDDPDSTRRMRYFNNVYSQVSLSDNFRVVAGFDLGLQQRTKNSDVYDFWLTPTVIAQMDVCEKWKAAVRAEYYQDETGIIIFTGTPNGFQTTGLSLNVDYVPVESFMCRLEGRWFGSQDEIFETSTGFSDNTFFLGASMAVKFGGGM